MKVYRVPRRVIWLWVIRLGIVGLGVAAALKMFHVKQNLYFAITTATVLMAAAVVFYLCVYIKNYEICVTNAAITVKSGVIIKKERILPSPRMVFVETYVTPLEKVFKLETIAFRAVKSRIITMAITQKDAMGILVGVFE